MKKVYICSAYASQGDREQNIKNAIGYCREAIWRGYLPIAPHVFYTQMLNDDREKERAAGLALGMELLKDCDEIWVFGIPKGGMVEEVEKAKELGIKVVFMLQKGGRWSWPKASFRSEQIR